MNARDRFGITFAPRSSRVCVRSPCFHTEPVKRILKLHLAEMKRGEAAPNREERCAYPLTWAAEMTWSRSDEMRTSRCDVPARVQRAERQDRNQLSFRA